MQLIPLFSRYHIPATVISANDEPDVPGWRNKKTDKIPPNAPPNSFANPSAAHPSVGSVGVKVPIAGGDPRIAGGQQQQQQQQQQNQKQQPYAQYADSGDFALSPNDGGGGSGFSWTSNWFVTVSLVLLLLLLLNWIRKTKGLTIKRRFNYVFKKIGF